MNDKQRLHETEGVLAVILQEQELLKTETHFLRTERDRTEEHIAWLNVP